MGDSALASLAFGMLLNAGLLLALAQIFDLLLARKGIDWLRRPSWVVGAAVGLLAILLIRLSVALIPGLVFDTRSVLLSLCGLFLGPVPTLVAIAVAAAYRIWLGGVAMLTGVGVIVVSGLLGLLWRHRLGASFDAVGARALLALGLVVHLAMLALMLLMPWDVAVSTLRLIALPVLVIHPLVTLALGSVISERLQRQRDLVALAAREDLYRSLFSNNHLPMLVIDPDSGAIVDANPAAARYYGWPHERLVRMNIAEINVLSPTEIAQEMRKAREARRSHFEFRHRRADGSVRDVQVFTGPVQIGGRTRLYSIIDDESERRQAQRALEDSERRLRLALEAANQGIYDVNLRTGEITVTPTYSTMLGYDPVGIRQTLDDWKAQLHPDDRARVIALFGDYLAGRASQYRVEYRQRTRDGGWRWILSMGSIVERDPAGRPLRMLGAHTSVDDRRRAEEAQHAAEERFRAITEQSIVGIFTIEGDLRISYMNPRGEEIFGYFDRGIEGMAVADIVHPEDREAVLAALDRQFERGDHAHAYEFRGSREDGTTVLVGAHGVIAEVGARRVVLGVLQDITDRRRLEATVQEYVKRLEGAVLATADAISHLVELRDPYTAGHQRRVSALACAIAAEMGKDEEFQRGLRVAGAVHDVGKITVPAEILAKPGALTALEYALIKEHAEHGYHALKDIDFPWPVAEVARQHHERVDGSGYPRGLKADQILLEARIVAVADVIESMANHRPYRPTRGIEAALHEIEQGAGRLYDGEVAAACLRLFRERGYVMAADVSAWPAGSAR